MRRLFVFSLTPGEDPLDKHLRPCSMTRRIPFGPRTRKDSSGGPTPVVSLARTRATGGSYVLFDDEHPRPPLKPRKDSFGRPTFDVLFLLPTGRRERSIRTPNPREGSSGRGPVVTSHVTTRRLPCALPNPLKGSFTRPVHTFPSREDSTHPDPTYALLCYGDPERPRSYVLLLRLRSGRTGRLSSVIRNPVRTRSDVLSLGDETLRSTTQNPVRSNTACSPYGRCTFVSES